MTQQTSDTPELKYSEETFGDMYEALRGLMAAWDTVTDFDDEAASKLNDSIQRAHKALSAAEAKHEQGEEV